MLYRALAILIAVGLATTAVADQERTNIGVLTCTVARSAEAPARNMTCGFKPTGSGAEEKYTGSFVSSGQPTTTGKQVLVWAVIGPANAKLSGGLLAQRYVKADGAPGQPPIWVGETNTGIVLQFETNGGAETSSAITHVELSLTGTSA
jgi:hypothetical protein